MDVGSTNVKATLFDRGLNVLESRSTASAWHEGPPYLHIDPEPVIEFARQSIAEFDRMLPVDAIVPGAHGSSLALLDDGGELTLPIMAYEAQPPERVRSSYAEIAPAFDEVFAPTNPGALTLGLQLLWQETEFAAAFAATHTILPLGQYVAYRLCGDLASEVTALGAQTHLWDPQRRDYSSLAKSRGWAARFAPMMPAWRRLGALRDVQLRGEGHVLAGIHDSNANYLRYAGESDFALLSTGTWIIAFDAKAPITMLDRDRDQVSNTTALGDPVACCRFMGGREFELVAGGAGPGEASEATTARLIEDGVFALPSFTDSGGPMPQTGGQGRIVGETGSDPAVRASLASLYCAQMTAVALGALGTCGRVIVDGPFSANQLYLSVLAALLADCEIAASKETNGTSTGAAMLARMDGPAVPSFPVGLRNVRPAQITGLTDYHARWLEQAGQTQ